MPDTKVKPKVVFDKEKKTMEGDLFKSTDFVYRRISKVNRPFGKIILKIRSNRYLKSHKLVSVKSFIFQRLIELK